MEKLRGHSLITSYQDLTEGEPVGPYGPGLAILGAPKIFCKFILDILVFGSEPKKKVTNKKIIECFSLKGLQKFFVARAPKIPC